MRDIRTQFPGCIDLPCRYVFLHFAKVYAYGHRGRCCKPLSKWDLTHQQVKHNAAAWNLPTSRNDDHHSRRRIRAFVALRGAQDARARHGKHSREPPPGRIVSESGNSYRYQNRRVDGQWYKLPSHLYPTILGRHPIDLHVSK